MPHCVLAVAGGKFANQPVLGVRRDWNEHKPGSHPKNGLPIEVWHYSRCSPKLRANYTLKAAVNAL